MSTFISDREDTREPLHGMQRSIAPQDSYRVLAVDDQPENLMVVRAVLEPLGFEVATAEGSATGYQMAVEQPPDLAVLDVMMPGESGIELCTRLRRNPGTRAMPILLLTALDAEDSRARGLQAGADEYMEKPVDVEQLVERVRSLIALGSRWSGGRPGETSTRLEDIGDAPDDMASLVVEAAFEACHGGDLDVAVAMARAAGIDVSERLLAARSGARGLRSGNGHA